MDRISNMLSSLKNASMAGKPYVEVNYTKELEKICQVLKNHKFLADVRTFKPSGKSFKMLHLDLVYNARIPVISEVKRISKPGRRIYATYQELSPVAGGTGVLVVSTSRGIISGYEAKKKKLGGEVICKVY